MARSPARTADQRMEALAYANDVRIGRARLKRALKEGRVSIADIVRSPPSYAEGAKVAMILTGVQKIGPQRTRSILRACGISPAKTLAGITERQRAALLDEVTKLQEKGLIV